MNRAIFSASHLVSYLRTSQATLRNALLARLALNSSWLFLTRVANQLLMMTVTIVIARGLGDSTLGRYAFVTSLVLTGNVLTTFGTDTLLIREIAGRRDLTTRSIPAALMLQLILSLAFILVLVLAAREIPQQPAETILALKLYSLSLLPLALFSVFSAILRGLERMDLFLLLNLATASLQLVGVAFIVKSRGNLVELSTALLAAQLLSAVVAFYLVKIIQPGLQILRPVDWMKLVSIIRKAWPLALIMVLSVLYQRMGVIGLNLYAQDRLAGWFTAAARPVEGLKILHFSLLGAFFPVMSHLSTAVRSSEKSASQRLLDRINRNTLGGLLIFGVLAALAIHFLAGYLVAWLYGPQYSPAAGALRILTWSLVPYAYRAQISLRLVTDGRELAVLNVLAASVILTTLCNVLLIPALGITGASLAALAGECIHALLFLLATNNNRFAREPRRSPLQSEG